MGKNGEEFVYWPTDKWCEVEYAENVFANILSRLPVKSLLMYKSVCKHWHEVISSQAFIDLQLLCSKNHSIYIVYPFMKRIMELNLMEHGEITKRITFPYCGNLSSLTIVSSFYGLLCCINYCKIVEDETDLEIRICNPVTRKALLLPKGSPSQEIPSIGVAFGPKIKEYKIFRFFVAKHMSLAKHQSHGNRHQCEVYSSSTGSWSVVGYVPYCPMRTSHSPLGSNHVSVNGNIYWFIASKKNHMIPGSILTVDVEKSFKTIKLPEKVTEHSYLVDLEGCLSLVVVHDEHETVIIWILADKDKPKWQLKWSDQVPFSNYECVEFVAAREREILFITSNQYYIYDLDHKSWSELDLPSISKREFPVAFAYTESLLSCGGHMDC